MNPSRFYRVFGLLLLCAVSAHSAVVLEWSRPAGTNVITDYSVYWGGSSRNYTNHVCVGTNQTATITNLLQNRTYYFAAKAESYGLESDLSNEVSAFTRLNIVEISLTVQTNNSPTGVWRDWLTLPVQTVTNPVAINFYRGRMNITNL